MKVQYQKFRAKCGLSHLARGTKNNETKHGTGCHLERRGIREEGKGGPEKPHSVDAITFQRPGPATPGKGGGERAKK